MTKMHKSLESYHYESRYLKHGHNCEQLNEISQRYVKNKVIRNVVQCYHHLLLSA